MLKYFVFIKYEETKCRLLKLVIWECSTANDAWKVGKAGVGERRANASKLSTLPK